MDSKRLSALETDAIGEILNISLGSSATALSMLLRRRVEITIPKIEFVTRESFEFGQFQPAIGVDVVYVEGLEGSNILLLKRADIKAIYEILMGDIEIADSEFEVNDLSKSAVCEVMNQMMGASATAMSDFLNRRINISTPVTFEVSQEKDFIENHFKGQETMVVGRFGLDIVGKLKSEFLFLMPIRLCRELIQAFLPAGVKLEDQTEGSEDMAEEIRTEEEQTAPVPQMVPAAGQPNPVYGQQTQPAVPSDAENLLLQQLTQQQAVMTQMLQQMQQLTAGNRAAEPKMIKAQPLGAQTLGDGIASGVEQPENLDLIMGVPLEVTVEIGRARHLIKDILEFTKGSLVVLDKLAGEQVDLLVNGQLVAKGDVVVVEDNFGVRITEIVEKPEIAIKNRK